MSSLRCMSKLVRIVNSPLFSGQKAGSLGTWNTIRHSSFQSSEVLSPEEENRISQKKIEIIQNPPEWKYVERLLGTTSVPQVNAGGDYLPSGWRPPKSIEELKSKYAYYVNRSKNHQIPVYSLSTFRGHRKITKLKRVEGDIWALEADLKSMLETRLKKRIETRVNEVSGQIDFKGLHVGAISKYLMQKGF